MKLALLCIGSLVCSVSGLALGRRGFWGCAAGAISTASSPSTAIAIIQVERCDSGIGPGCEQLPSDDPSASLIESLRKKSAANKATRDAEDLRRYNGTGGLVWWCCSWRWASAFVLTFFCTLLAVNNFGDFFQASYPPKKLVMYPSSGKFETLTESELSLALKEGKVKAGSAGSFQSNYSDRMGFYFVE
jgi:hypothetical protein